jgi:hypothetical protein
MCLICDIFLKEKSKKDITCYKIVFSCIADESKHVTPYQLFPISNDVLDGKENFKAEGKEDIFGLSSSYVSGGFIHAFTDFSSAHVCKRELASNPRFIGRYRPKMYECVIPKGTIFVRGNYNEICAKQIKFVKEIKFC